MSPRGAPWTRRDTVLANRSRAKRAYKKYVQDLERAQRMADRAWARYCKYDDELYQLDTDAYEEAS